MTSRRKFLSQSAASLGAITVLPCLAAQASTATELTFADGSIILHPIHHASCVLETPSGVIYVDPVGDAAAYAKLPQPDLIVITHEHADHYNPELLSTFNAKAPILTNPAVFAMLPEDLKARAQALKNGDTTEAQGITITAIPAYNTTKERQKFHPQGRDNGYVLSLNGTRIYISGDTEDIPEMRALSDIDVALLCMNLPFTMTAQQAADAVAEFKPRVVIPYHYRGRDGGTQDPKEFAAALQTAAPEVTVTLYDWYDGALG